MAWNYALERLRQATGSFMHQYVVEKSISGKKIFEKNNSNANRQQQRN